MYFAALIFLTALAPLNGFPIISHVVHITSDASTIILPMAGEKFYLTMQTDNALQNQMNFTFVTEVINEYGYTDSIKTIDLSIAALQTTTMANPLIPPSAGNYTIKAFVLSDTNKPSLLAEPRVTSLDVAEFHPN